MLQVLDTVIGIVFFFGLFSLLCTAIYELAQAFVKGRSKLLWQGLHSLFGGSANAGSKPPGILREVYAHPLVYGLYKGDHKEGKGDLPSYIPARNFALALIAVVLKDPDGEKVFATTTPLPDSAVPPVVTEPNTLPKLSAIAEKVRENAKKYSDSNISQALLALGESADWDPVRFRENIEDWYNSAMDRVSGRYKRHTQLAILGIAFLGAIVFNADAINIAKTLSNDPALRSALVAKAEKYIGENASGPVISDPPSTIKLEDGSKKVEKAIGEVRALGLPIGWDDANLREDWWRWALRVLGWLFTALAATIGAPFWFDLLNRFMIVRSTVKPKEKSPDEPALDRT